MSSQPNQNTVDIDDGDINDDLQYQTADLWDHFRNQPNVQEGTYSAGYTDAKAEVRFNGTSVQVYGAAAPRPPDNQSADPPSVSFVLDGGIPVTVVSNPDLPDTEYSHQFYDSRTLSEKEHVLQMVVDYASGDWPFVLDYIRYTPFSPGSDSAAAGLDTGTSAASKRHTGAVVGAVVGGVVFLVVLAIARYLLVRRAPKKSTRKQHIDLLDQESKIAPSSFAHSAVNTLGANEDVGQTPNSGTEFLLTPSSHYALSDTESHITTSRPSSPTPLFHRPSTPSLGSQRYSLPPTSSFIFNRPGTPTSGYQHSATTMPPAVLHRPGTPATPVNADSPAVAVQVQVRPQDPPGLGATNNRAIEKQAAEEARLVHKRPNFHSDSGRRFAGNAPPLSVPVSVPAPTRVLVLAGSESGEADKESEEKKREKEKRVSYGGSAITEVPPMYTRD